LSPRPDHLHTRDHHPGPAAARSPWRTVVLAGLLFAAGLVGAVGAASPADAAGPTSRFLAVTPARLADTRQANCSCTVLDGSTIRVQVTGRAGVPAQAVAAALTVTVAGAASGGYATVWPSGAPRQETSTLNWSAGQTRANGTIVPLGSGGAVDVFVEGSFSAASIVVDVTGVFVPASTATAGQFRPLGPARLLDTRTGAPIGAGSTVRVPLPAGVPADATALVVNVTTTDGSEGGYLTASAAGAALPATSTVNTDGPGQTRAATAIVPVSAQGIDVYASGGTHAIVDVFGWFTGASAGASSVGLFVPMAPMRAFDTRRALAPLAPSAPQRLYADDGTAAAAIAAMVPASSALVLNTTVTEAAGDGFLAAFPARQTQPTTSSLNWRAGETVANLAITPTSTYGVSFAASTSAHAIADVTGYFTGSPIAVAPPAPPAGAKRDPDAVRILASAVTPEVMTTLGGVDVGFLPDGNMPANDNCFGQVGVASSSMVGTAPQVWQITYQRLSLARGLVTACQSAMQAASAAAHEASHLVIDRWHYEPTNAAAQQHRKALSSSLDGGVECLAEAMAQAMFTLKGIGPYMVGYGGIYQGCAGSASSQALSRQILSIAG
jgi:hypothetical protein